MIYDQRFEPKRGETKCHSILTAVVKENWNEEKKGLVKVEFFMGEAGKKETAWIPVAAPYTASGSGIFFLPEVGSEVIVGFVNGSFNRPIVLGSLWNSQHPPGDTFATQDNVTKTIRTGAGHEILFDETEEKGKITIQTATNLKISLEDETKKVTMSNGQPPTLFSIDFENGKVELKADTEMVFTVGGEEMIKLESGTIMIKSDTVKLEGNQGLNLKGQNTEIKGNSVKVQSDAALDVKAGAKLGLEGSAMAELKGGMVKIN